MKGSRGLVDQEQREVMTKAAIDRFSFYLSRSGNNRQPFLRRLSELSPTVFFELFAEFKPAIEAAEDEWMLAEPDSDYPA